MYHSWDLLIQLKKGAPHVQVLRPPMQTPSKQGCCLAKDGSGVTDKSLACMDRERECHEYVDVPGQKLSGCKSTRHLASASVQPFSSGLSRWYSLNRAMDFMASPTASCPSAMFQLSNSFATWSWPKTLYELNFGFQTRYRPARSTIDCRQTMGQTLNMQHRHDGLEMSTEKHII